MRPEGDVKFRAQDRETGEWEVLTLANIMEFDRDYFPDYEHWTQSTNLATKELEEIFEDDLLRTRNNVWLVEYDNKMTSWVGVQQIYEKRQRVKRLDALVYEKDASLIGNKFDNPDKLHKNINNQG